MRIIVLILLLFLVGCKNEGRNYQMKTFLSATNAASSHIDPKGTNVSSRIKVPEGYIRIQSKVNSFGAYLQNFPLKPDGSKVYLYNGNEKYRQDVHVAVLDISIGTQDLQQCADATMRLRAEYLYKQKKYDSIYFNFTNGFKADYTTWSNGNRIKVNGNKVKWIKSPQASYNYASFQEYLKMVFMYAGTLSLSQELPTIAPNNMAIGDIFIKGGSPGHAVIVMDIAENTKGEKIFLLAQSYMPAQNIHLLKNPTDSKLSPWYALKDLKILETPEWNFTKNDLKRWH